MKKATRENLYLYSTRLRPVARALRKNMTKAEAYLWKFVLRAGMLNGYTFNRQRPVLNFVVDFFCKKLLLVIEVDGISHHDNKTQEKDRDKERKLTEAGFTVIRFTDDEVLNNIDGVREKILYHICRLEQRLKFPPPLSPS